MNKKVFTEHRGYRIAIILIDSLSLHITHLISLSITNSWKRKVTSSHHLFHSKRLRDISESLSKLSYQLLPGT